MPGSHNSKSCPHPFFRTRKNIRPLCVWGHTAPIAHRLQTSSGVKTGYPRNLDRWLWSRVWIGFTMSQCHSENVHFISGSRVFKSTAISLFRRDNSQSHQFLCSHLIHSPPNEWIARLHGCHWPCGIATMARHHWFRRRRRRRRHRRRSRHRHHRCRGRRGSWWLIGRFRSNGLEGPLLLRHLCFSILLDFPMLDPLDFLPRIQDRTGNSN